MTEHGPIVEVRDLRIVRGKREVLALDHLALSQGERLAVIGPNGAGKSTLLEVMALLRQPDAGTVCLDGKPVSWRQQELIRARRRIAVVFQRPLLLRGTLLENVVLAVRLRGERDAPAEQAARKWLARLGVSHLADRQAEQVSVGEAQRASIARALVVEPAVLLLDEPFAALDSLARHDLLDSLEVTLRDQRCAVVLVTHDWREVRRLADRVAVLFGGRIAQFGTVAEIESYPATPEVAALLSAAS